MIERNKFFELLVFTCIVSSSDCDDLLRNKRNAGENDDLKTNAYEKDIGGQKHGGSSQENNRERRNQRLH